MLSEIFWTMVVSSSVMVLMGLAKLISKSRCDEIRCCGCSIHRNVELENQEARIETKENV
jgi:hypothetical protein